AGLAGLAWAAGGTTLGVLLARWFGFPPGDQRASWAAWWAMLAVFSLWNWAGVLRRGRPTAKGETIVGQAAAAALLRRFAGVIEAVASGVGVLASALVLAIGLSPGASEGWVTFAGIGVLFSAALLHIFMARRWQSEGPVYAAQVLMV